MPAACVVRKMGIEMELRVCPSLECLSRHRQCLMHMAAQREDTLYPGTAIKSALESSKRSTGVGADRGATSATSSQERRKRFRAGSSRGRHLLESVTPLDACTIFGPDNQRGMTGETRHSPITVSLRVPGSRPLTCWHLKKGHCRGALSTDREGDGRSTPAIPQLMSRRP